MSIIRNILVRVGANIEPFQTGMTQAQHSLNTFQTGMTAAVNHTNSSMGAMGSILGKLGGIVAAAFAIDKMVEFGKSSVALASNLNEVQNVVDVTFGGMSNQINDFAKNAITQFGISELSAKRFASAMGAMLKSSGLSGQQIVTMSEGITGLSADMASFYNLDSQDAFDKIRAGIAGEVEPLRQLGINMSVANMEAYALSQGITTKYQAMNQASQSLLRYNYLMSVTKDAQGDFARTTSSWANQTRLLSQQWDIMKTTLGQGLINMLTPLLTVINNIIAKLQVAAAWFKALTEMIWGSAGAVSAVVTPAAGATDGIDAVGTSADNTGSKVKKAAAAIKGSLGAFDQLNVLGQKAGAADGSGGSGAGGAGEVPTVSVSKPNVGLPDIKLPTWMESLKNISFQPLMESLGKLKTALEPFTKTIGEGLGWLFENILVPLGTWTVQEALPAFFNALAGAATILNPILLAFKPTEKWLWEEFLQPIAKWTGGVIVATLNGLGEELKKIGKWMTDNQTTVTKTTEFVIGFFAAWKGVELLAFIEMSGGVTRAFTLITDAIKAATIAKIADKFETIALTAMYAKDLIVSVASGTLAFFKQTAQVWLLSASMAAQSIASGVLSIATKAAAAAQWLFNAALEANPIGLVVLAIAGLIAAGVLLYQNWDTVKENLHSAWVGIKNTFISGVNGVIDLLNKFRSVIGMPMIAKIGLDVSGNDSADGMRIGRNANGTNNWRGGWSWVGENGPELIRMPKGSQVIPNNKISYNAPELSKDQPNDGLVSAIASAVSQAIGSSGSGNSSGDLVIKVGESEFARISIRSINNLQRQAGMTLLTV